METLLIVAIVATALSVVVQAGALVGMYLLSRQTTEKVNSLIEESHKLMGPLESVATNFKSASNVFVDVSKDARQEMHHIRSVVTETSGAVRSEIQELRDRVNETASELQSTVLKPVREWSAIAIGVTAGVKSLFRRRRVTVTPAEGTVSDEPAA
jgi:ElaB/YqjD/DUF883 family membrane-anchored ribosome-binding protein